GTAAGVPVIGLWCNALVSRASRTGSPSIFMACKPLASVGTTAFQVNAAKLLIGRLTLWEELSRCASERITLPVSLRHCSTSDGGGVQGISLSVSLKSIPLTRTVSPGEAWVVSSWYVMPAIAGAAARAAVTNSPVRDAAKFHR